MRMPGSTSSGVMLRRAARRALEHVGQVALEGAGQNLLAGGRPHVLVEDLDVVTRYGGVPVAYGDGLEQRVREVAPEGVVAALDCVGTDEAVDVSLALVSDRDRIVTIAAFERAKADGLTAIAGAMPASEAYRDSVRADLVRWAGEGRLVVPVARTFPLADAPDAAELLMSQHPGGKLVLEP